MKGTTLVGTFLLLTSLFLGKLFIEHAHSIQNCSGSGFVKGFYLLFIIVYWFGGVLLINKPELVRKHSDLGATETCMAMFMILLNNLPVIFEFECYRNYNFTFIAPFIFMLNALLIQYIPGEQFCDRILLILSFVIPYIPGKKNISK